MLGSGAIAWSSKKQPITALSSTEAEYIFVTSAACEVVWLRRLLQDMNEKQACPTTLMCNNKYAISIARNPILHGRTKHIDTRYHFIRDLIKDGTINIIHCSTLDQVADVFTKGLPNCKFEALRNMLGMRGSDLLLFFILPLFNRSLEVPPSPPPPPPPRISLSSLISCVFFFVGAIGIVFAIVVLLRPPRTVQVSVFRCGRAKDTLRNFRSRSSVGGGAGLEDRPKLLGFVGVQTRFGFADRRAVLRSTWFPSDPEALTRTKDDPVILAEYVVALLRNDKPKKELQKLCADSLVEFLGLNEPFHAVNSELQELPSVELSTLPLILKIRVYGIGSQACIFYPHSSSSLSTSLSSEALHAEVRELRQTLSQVQDREDRLQQTLDQVQDNNKELQQSLLEMKEERDQYRAEMMHQMKDMIMSFERRILQQLQFTAQDSQPVTDDHDVDL
ncbi:uncharacterized protein LOC120271728 [Dioscorea cayenensis subsp. rotundata]|uniref:Uncharacterized protein LOC120271728 n=1 Tax=Dioscorea cayennensis subsp. rotundata TaxID=55577 RepID=A0AB40C3H9_DIOCR|nr:uncharacterized protein LOC120271728 [Dioscorea cayenensis subsp. rotundata]